MPATTSQFEKRRVIGNFSIDVETRTLFKNSEPQKLRGLAFDLLVVLYDRPNRLVKYEELLKLVWNETHANTHKVQQMMRRVVAALGSESKRIRNFDGHGYMLERITSEHTQNKRHASQFEDFTMNSRIIEKRLMTKFLKRYYEDDDLRAEQLFPYQVSVDGTSIPTNIATKSSWLGLRLSIHEEQQKAFPLCSSNVQLPVTTPEEISVLRRALSAKKVRFKNRPIYCLQSFGPGGKTIASFAMAHYADYKCQLGRLEEELVEALAAANFDPMTAYRSRSRRTRLRNKLLPNAKVMANYPARLCAGGTNVLVAFRRPRHDGFAFFVKRRSKKGVSTSRGRLSLIPTGMHQPVSQAHAEETTSVAATVYREILEEIFGAQELKSDERQGAPLWYMSKPQLEWFRNNRNDRRKFSTEIVSFGLNLIDGTYEFGVLVAIHDTSYWERFHGSMPFNWEVDDTETPLYSTVEPDRLAALMTDPYLADVSLIVLVEGLKRLAQLAPRRVTLPHLQVQPA